MAKRKSLVLVLDDCEGRHNLFARHLALYSGITGHQERFVSKTIERLAGPDRYKYVFLDHDLGLSDPTHNGMEVVDWVIRRVKLGSHRFDNTLFVIHSMNRDEAPKMVSKLKAAGLAVKRVPLAWEVLADARN